MLQKGAVGAYLLSSSLVGGATVLGTTLPLLYLLPSAYTAAVAAIQTAWGYFLCGVAGVCVCVCTRTLVMRTDEAWVCGSFVGRPR